MSRLKSELSWLRRRGAIKTEEDDGLGERACGRCRVELGRIINRGADCRACRQRVCKQCREYSVNGRDWVCLVCHKQIEIQLASGEWMNEFIRRPSRRRETKVYVPPADVVKRSLIKRSWTISSPPSGGRSSPELRAHASRPVISPRKPPRGPHTPTDENEPPWDAPLYPHRGAPPRRYSMSSFDGVPSGSRHLKGPAPLPPQDHHNQGAPSPCGSPQRYASPCESPVPPQRRRMLPDLPQQPTRAPPSKPLRPSTLPRKLRERESRDSSRYSPPPSSNSHDPNRFHSMPRTRGRSPSGQGRGRSEPSHRSQSPVMPLRENPALGGYISSGPVTSTPIKHDPVMVHNKLGSRNSAPPTPAPRDLSRPPANGRPPDQGTTSNSTSSSSSSSSMRKHPHHSSPGGITPSRPESEGNGYTHKLRTPRIEVEGGSLGRPTRRRDGGDLSHPNHLEVDNHHLNNHNNRIPNSRPDSGVSGSSRGGTSDNSDYDGDGSGVFRKIAGGGGGGPRSRQAASPPGLTSGYATTGRRPTKTSHNPAAVRRSRSFQVGTRRLEDEFSSPSPPPGKESLSGQVARYVKELERGIQMTVENMKPSKKPPLPPGDAPLRPPPSCSPSKDSSSSHSVGRSRSLGRRQSDKQNTSSPSDTSDTGNSRLDFDDRSTFQHSDHSSSNNRHSDTASDIVLDAEKILPEGDDYKIVFISSDSSKDSELNSSIDSDNSGSPSRRVSSINTVNDSDTAGFIDESDWDYYESESQSGRRRRKNNNTVNDNNTHNNNINNHNNIINTPRVIMPTRVDACVMTEGEYLSGTASEGEDSEVEFPRVPDSSLHLSLRVPSPEMTIPCHQRDDSGVSNATTESQELQVSFDDNTTTTTTTPVKDIIIDNAPPSPPLLPTLRSLDTEELHAMLRQTEAVQAEAQALQAALMGAFAPSEAVLSAIPGGGRWFARGDSTRSSAERSMGEFSCHDQVRALGVNTPHESPALREYRKRVLTEIQNYYGVSSDMTGGGGGGGLGGRPVGGRGVSHDTQPAHGKPRPDLHAYVTQQQQQQQQQHHHQHPPRQVSSANAPKILSPLSYQQRHVDKNARVPQSHDRVGTSATTTTTTSSGSSSSSGKTVPSSSVAASNNVRRKTSRDICIQTDPDPAGVINRWGDGDSTPEPVESTPSKLGPTRDVMEEVRMMQRDTTAARVSRLVERIPTGTPEYSRVAPSGHHHNVGGVRDGVGHFGSVGVGFRERGGSVGGEEVNPPILPHPPSFHLHLTLSRETSVAHPSDSETDDKLLDTSCSSCVSSDLGGESASDFEYQDDRSERWRRLKVERERHDDADGRGGSEVTKNKVHYKEEAKEYGGGHGEEEAPVCPRITAAPAIATPTTIIISNTTNTNVTPTPPTTHNIRPHPPQPAPRRTMSALRPHLPPTHPPHTHTSLLQPPPPHLQENGGDLDALERVIPPMETSSAPISPHPPLVLEASGVNPNPSSSTSEDDDTDEDIHVSRSYDICVGAADEVDRDSETEHLPEDEVSSHLEAEHHGDSSTSSGSDTDEGKHVSKEYRLTKSSSTESEFEKFTVEETVEVEGDVDKTVCLSESLSVTLKDEGGVEGGGAVSVSQDDDGDHSVVNDSEELNNQVLSDLIINNNNINISETVSNCNISDNNSFNSNNDMSLSSERSGSSLEENEKAEEGDNKKENEEKENKETKDNENSNDSVEIRDKQQSDKAVASDHQTKDLGGENEGNSAPLNSDDGVDGVGDSEIMMVLEEGSGSEEGEEVVEKHDLESTSENVSKESKSNVILEVNTNTEENVKINLNEIVNSSVVNNDGDDNDDDDEVDRVNLNVDDCVEAINKELLLNPLDSESQSMKSEVTDVLDSELEVTLSGREVSEATTSTKEVVSLAHEDTDSHEAITVDEAIVTHDTSASGTALENDITPIDPQGQETRPLQEPHVSLQPKKAEADALVEEEGIAVEVSEGLDSVKCLALLEGSGHAISESDHHSIPGESEGLLGNGDAESQDVIALPTPLGESPGCTGAGTGAAVAGSAQVEQSEGGGTEHTPVTHGAPRDEHVPLQPLLTDDGTTVPPSSPLSPDDIDTSVIDSTLEEEEDTVIENISDDKVKEEEEEKGDNSAIIVGGESSESGHSSAGESEVEEEEGEATAKVVKISVTEEGFDDDGVSIPVSVLDSEGVRQEVTRFAVRRVRSPEVTSRRTPPVPSRRTKRSSSSDGISSSSDIERSDADASDSADTVVEGGKLHTELRRFALQQRIHDHDDKGRDSDGPSSADSVLHGADSESQCSDNSEEGNLVSIVSVGDDDDHTTRLSSHGRIYIRSDSTDSDVQIKPTCIVVTGSSGAESGDDGDDKNNRNIKNSGNDVTILEVTSDGRCGHVMSVHVTSPDSSRSASPARRSQVSELQSMILTTRERQSHFRRSPTELKENSSSLANYFTRTLGTDSPHAPRRLNKTPEIRRRKVDRPEIIESPATTSPSSPAATPDHSEGDLLAYEENHGINIEDEYTIPHDYDSSEDPERGVSFPDETALFNDDVSFDENHPDFPEGDEYEGIDIYVDHDAEGRFDSIEDGESINSESNYSESSGDEIMEREDELRGYCNRAIDFTLHTIIEESCEESDYERKPKDEDGAQGGPSELEKYFYFGLGNGPADPKRYANEESEYSDTFSETSSSIFSEGVDVDPKYDEDIDPAELASSRLEKYFLTGLIGFERQPSIRSVGEDSELHTDESGSVGSDSEGSPSPEQPRKKLVRRPRGFRPGVANRALVTSDRGDWAPSDGSHHSEGDEVDRTLVSGEDEGSTESEETAFDKGDGQFDTIKRRKKKKSSSDYSDKRSDSDKSELRVLEQHELELKEDICDLKNAETLKSLVQEQEKITKRVMIDCEKDKNDDKMEREGDLSDRKYQSRDSGFIGSSDDLLKDKPEDSYKEQKMRSSSESSVENVENSKRKDDKKEMTKSQENKCDSFDNDSNNNKSENEDRSSGEGKVSRSSTGSSVDLPPFSPNKARSKICRKDSFNNWSSDEETNMMMNKMRAFFKTMISNTREAPKGQRVKPPQLLAFEAKLTNLMKTVPGINDEQVKEIVEYLSSEDTWSDSYDSSDYTSSDLEGAYALLDQADPEMKSDLQEQISASCKQIIQKFDQSREPSDTDSAHSLFGGRAYSESSEDASPSSKDTVFVYQRLMSSISRLKPDSDRGSIGSGSQGASPPLLAKVMHHIGNRLVALMHEVSGGSENGDEDTLSLGHPVTSSPKVPLFLPRKHKSVDSISIDSSVEKSSLTSTSFESEDSPTDTEQSPESDPGTPKARKRQDLLSVISERSSAEDFTSLESQRTVFASHDSPRHQTRLDAAHPHQTTASQRSLEERGVTNIQYFVTEGSNNEVEVWQSVTIDEDKFDAREHHGVPRARRSARRQETRKAKSHMSLEKIHQEEVKNTGERSESLGDLLDRVRSSEFSSSYEQLDSDSTLKASDSLDRHIGSSSSNIRLNASSRGSLNTSSRGSLAASSRGSLNAGSRGSLQGSSGPEEEDEKKPKKLSFFRYARRSSMPDTSKDHMSPEVRSTTLPRSNPTQVASTASLPRSQSALFNKTMPSVTSHHASYSSPPSTFDRLTGVTGPRSARYHAPGYKPPPPPATPKKTISPSGHPASLRKDVLSSWAPQDESTGSLEEGLGQKSGSPSPLAGSVGRISGRESVASLASSTDNSTVTHPDEDIERLMQITEKKRNSLTPLGSRSESMASVCSAGAEGRYGTVIVKGEIELGLQYNYKEGQLECHVVQCRELAAVDAKRNRSDPYVKVYLLPDKSKSGKRKTKVKKHTLNPIFEEVLRFSTTMSELDSRHLWVSVWHSDMFGRNDFLGEVIIALADTVFDDVTPKWYPLQDRTEPMEDMSYSPKGDLIMALKFVPPEAVSSRKARRSRGALHVLVKEAKSLAAARPHGTADPICKGLLLPEKGKASKQKTSVCRKTLNPTWNHTLVFDDTSLQELTERALELSVWDHDRLGTSQFLGGCRLSLGKGKHGGRPVEWMEAAGMEVKLWEQMLERPNLWVEGSIMLRPTMDKPIYSSSMTE